MEGSTRESGSTGSPEPRAPSSTEHTYKIDPKEPSPGTPRLASSVPGTVPSCISWDASAVHAVLSLGHVRNPDEM
jgi:hypothetical protein